MKLRFPRDDLAASMATVRTVEPTLAAIAAELTAEWAWHGASVAAADLTLQPHGRNDAIGWDEHLLLLNGEPVAFTDGPILGSRPLPPFVWVDITGHNTAFEIAGSALAGHEDTQVALEQVRAVSGDLLPTLASMQRADDPDAPLQLRVYWLALGAARDGITRVIEITDCNGRWARIAVRAVEPAA